jgi:hypothetical protein
VQAYVDGESELIVVQPTHIFSPVETAFEDGMMFQWPGNATAIDLVSAAMQACSFLYWAARRMGQLQQCGHPRWQHCW